MSRRRGTVQRMAMLLAVALLLAATARAAWRGDGHVSGQVRDIDGKPVAGATVTLIGEEGDGPAPIHTDKKGRWSAIGLAGGTWKLSVAAAGFVTSEGKIGVAEEGPSPAADVMLRPLAEETPAGAENPQAVVLWIEKGNTLLAQQRYPEARAEFEKALAELPREQKPQVLSAIARTWFQQGDVPRAVAALEDALRITPKDETLRTMFRMIREDQGKAKEADAFLAALDAGAAQEDGGEAAANDVGQAELPPEIAKALAAKPEAPVANRRGEYKVAFTEGAPSSSLAELLKRSGESLDEVRRYDAKVEAYDVRRESFMVHVPEGDPPVGGWAVMVWISPGEYGAPYHAARKAALQRQRMLWIGANAGGNDRPIWDRVRLALDAAWNVQRLYKVDPERVYVGGYSGGGRMASELTLLYPEVFRGGLMQMGVDFYRNLPMPDRPGAHWPSRFGKPSRESWKLVRERSRFVLLEGERDFNLVQTRLIARELKKDGVEHVTLLEVPGATHYTPIPEEWMVKALAALDGTGR